MQGSFGSLDLLIFVAVAIPLENLLSAPLVVAAPQELGDFEFDGFLKHELSAELNGLREGSPASGQAEELFLDELTGELAFHGCLPLSVWPAQLECAPCRLLQEA